MPHRKVLRLALLLPLLTTGCGFWDSWFGETKTPLPGKRTDVLSSAGALTADAGTSKVSLPAPAANAAWPQAGGDTTHDMEHPALGATLARAWTESIGAGGGYRRKVTAQAVIAGGLVFTMDSDAVVSAFDAASGSRRWSLSTEAENNRSTNIGGGIAWDNGTLYAATGRAEVLAINAADGKIIWRGTLSAGARAAPTVAAGNLYIPLIDNTLVALSATDGKRIWSYDTVARDPVVLGLPSPAFGEGVLLAGFGSGQLAALNPATGGVLWTDSLAASRGRNALADLSTIRGRSVIKAGRAYAASMGDQLAAFDLRSGRRLWERDIAASESPWVAGNWLFVATDAAQVAAVSLEDGRIAWVTQLDAYENPAKKTKPIRWLGPVLAGGRLFVAGTNGVLTILDPASGAILGKQDLPAAASVAPSVAGGTLYVVTDNGAVTAYR
jgi:outer membrane protein assembly factor BamB